MFHKLIFELFTFDQSAHIQGWLIEWALNQTRLLALNWRKYTTGMLTNTVGAVGEDQSGQVALPQHGEAAMSRTIQLPASLFAQENTQRGIHWLFQLTRAYVSTAKSLFHVWSHA